MKRIIALLSAFVFLVCSSVMAAGTDTGKEMSIGSDSFRILMLTDTQDDQHPAPDMINLITLAIKESDPDLIVFTGDLVEDSRIGDPGKDDEPLREGVVVKSNGEIDHDKTLANIKVAADAVLSVFQDSGVPFAIAQGNNDHKCGITNEEWMEIYSQYSNCLVCDMSDDADGRLDYNILLRDSDGKAVFNIWMIDTGRGGINDDQIAWYKKASAGITEANGGTPVPAFVFQHINVPDVGNLFEKCSPADEGARAVGTEFYRLNHNIANGYSFYGYKPCEESNEFRAWKECGDVIGAYFGHQHTDGFTGTTDGIELGFTYGCEMAKPGPYGYRLFTIDSNNPLDYTNELYTYEGSVKTGNAHFEKQRDEEYREYSNVFEKVIYSVKNLAVSFVSLVIDFFTSL